VTIRHRATFRRRVAFGSGVAVAVTVAVASGVMFVLVRGELRGQVDEGLRDRLRQILAPSKVYLQTSPGGVVQVVIPPPDVEGESPGYVQFVASDGSVLRPSAETGQFMEPTHASLAVAAGRRDTYFADTELDGGHYRVLTARMSGRLAVPERADPIPQPMAVQVARPLGDVDSALSRLAFLLVAISAVGIALGAVLGFLITRTAARPVRRLTETAEHVTATGDLAARIEVTGDDEVGRLAASFNRMLEALQRSVDAQRQLVADASHELRTPLTSLRTNIEVLSRAAELAPADRERLRRDVLEQLEEMTALVADLMDLARDGHVAARSAVPLRLDHLVEAAVERTRRRAPGVEFVTTLSPVVVTGVAERLDRAIGNLLDNAAKWSPPNGRVDVDVADGAVTVRDRGPGIAPEDLPFVFDRFYRSAAARGLPGSGLGLAIVRQVAESHGGSVLAWNAPDGGAVLRLSLSSSPVVPPLPPAPIAISNP
jgi:two-component system, OmpR family, sensor histidine kinase MprB